MTDVVKKWVTDWAAVAFSGTRTLASLAIDEWTDESDELNNITLGKAVFCDFHISLGSAWHRVVLMFILIGQATVPQTYKSITCTLLVASQPRVLH